MDKFLEQLMNQNYSKQLDKKVKDSHMNMLSQDGSDGNPLHNKHGITSLEFKSNNPVLILS